MKINIMTFGFKYGMPEAADMLFDVRFLQNPYWEEELRELTGLDAPVADYIFNFPESTEYFEKLCEFLDFTVPKFNYEGRGELTVAIGCTGGRHRSVAVAERLSARFNMKAEHRDINKQGV